MQSGEKILTKMDSDGQLHRLSKTIEDFIRDETTFAIRGNLIRAFEAEEVTAWIRSAAANKNQCGDIQGESEQYY